MKSFLVGPEPEPEPDHVEDGSCSSCGRWLRISFWKPTAEGSGRIRVSHSMPECPDLEAAVKKVTGQYEGTLVKWKGSVTVR